MTCIHQQVELSPRMMHSGVLLSPLVYIQYTAYSAEYKPNGDASFFTFPVHLGESARICARKPYCNLYLYSSIFWSYLCTQLQCNTVTQHLPKWLPFVAGTRSPCGPPYPPRYQTLAAHLFHQSLRQKPWISFSPLSSCPQHPTLRSLHRLLPRAS